MERIRCLHEKAQLTVELNVIDLKRYRDLLEEVRESFRPLGGGSIQLLYPRNSKLALLELQNASKRNAMSGKMMAELADAVDTLEKSSEDVTGVLLCSELGSKVFCAGFDLSICKIDSPYMTSEFGYLMSLLMQDTLLRLKMLPQVSVAAIDGPALGGGAELAVSCDFRFINALGRSDIKFLQSKMGLTTGWGGCQSLLNAFAGNSKRALFYLSTCKPIKPRDAQAYGFGTMYPEKPDDFIDFREASLLYLTKLTTYGESAKQFKDLVSRLTTLKDCASVYETDYWRSLCIERSKFASLWGGIRHVKAVENFAAQRRAEKVEWQ